MLCLNVGKPGYVEVRGRHLDASLTTFSPEPEQLADGRGQRVSALTTAVVGNFELPLATADSSISSLVIDLA